MDVITQEEKTPEMLQQILGVDEMTARFILAMEQGELSGDVFQVDETEAR